VKLYVALQSDALLQMFTIPISSRV